MDQLLDWLITVCNWLLWSGQVVWKIHQRDNLHPEWQLNPDRHTPDSDPAKHTSNPPVARHDNLTDDPPSSVVIWPRVETTQGLVVAAAVAVTTPTMLAAVAVVIQTVIQLDSNFSLQRTRERAELQSHTWQMPVLLKARAGEEDEEEEGDDMNWWGCFVRRAAEYM